MTREYQMTLADVDVILNNIDTNEKNKVPMKLQKFIHDNKLENYESSINTQIPIEEQALSKETTAFISMLYLNYWCDSEEEKEELKSQIHQNELDYQEELRKKYNVDNIFQKEEISISTENDTNDNTVENEETQNTVGTQMIEYKESFFRKLFNKIKSFFRR